MTHLALNPYLPLYEYIPDGEPRIFGNRLYVYGSHDYAGGALGFCPGDYMVWSAPLDDLGDWRCDGTAYRRSDCPEALTPGEAMAAPDVVKGVDGRYQTGGRFFCPALAGRSSVIIVSKPLKPGSVGRKVCSLFSISAQEECR